MSLEDIRSRHENLLNMVSTQSSILLSERRSQAHKDRGELLEIVQDLKERNAALLMEIGATRVVESMVHETGESNGEAKT